MTVLLHWIQVSFLINLNHSLPTAQGSDLPFFHSKACFGLHIAEYGKIHSSWLGFQPVRRKEKMHRMIKPDMIHVPSCRNINSIEYMASAAFVAFCCCFCCLGKGRILSSYQVIVFLLQFQHTNKLDYILFKISISSLF